MSTLLVLAMSLDVEAGKKKNKKKKSKKKAAASVTATTEVPKAKLTTSFSGQIRSAQKHLLAFNTSAAAAALESVESEREPAVLAARARVLEQNGSYDSAASMLEEAAAGAAGSPEPLIYLGEALLHAERPGAADDAFARAESRARSILSLDPENVDALYFLGVAEQRRMRFDDALETLTKVRAARPRDAVAAYQVGATLAFKKDWVGAMEALDEAIELDSSIAYAYYYRGLAAGQAGRKDRLVIDLDKFLKMAPHAPEAERARRVIKAAQ
ncbi:MAG: hypothetical protein GY769_19625 [bacterium]|nr:hypothetical protein [bacterium]